MLFKKNASLLLSASALSLVFSVTTFELCAGKTEYSSMEQGNVNLIHDVLEKWWPEADAVNELVVRVTNGQIVLNEERTKKLSDRVGKIEDKEKRTEGLELLRKFYENKAQQLNTEEAWLLSANMQMVGAREGSADFKKRTEHLFKALRLGSREAKEILTAENLLKTVNDSYEFRERYQNDMVSGFETSATLAENAFLEELASKLLEENNSERNFGAGARLHLLRHSLGVAGAKEDFYDILRNFKKIYSNYHSQISRQLYPVCLQEIEKGDDTTRGLVEANYTEYDFLRGVFEYYIGLGDQKSIDTAWDLYRNNKVIKCRDEKGKPQTFEITWWAARPFAEYYKKFADQGDLEACRRITEVSMPESTYQVSFKTATRYYAKAIDLGETSMRAGLMRTLERLKESAYEGLGLEQDFLDWAYAKSDSDLLIAVGDALKKDRKVTDHYPARDFRNAAKFYLRVRELGDARGDVSYKALLGSEDFSPTVEYKYYQGQEYHPSLAFAKIYPVVLEQSENGDQSSVEFLKSHANEPHFLLGKIRFLVEKGDDDSLEAAWNLVQEHKDMRDASGKALVFRADNLKPLIEKYEKKAEEEKESNKKIKIYQRLIQLSLMGDESSYSFKALFYTRAIDLGDVDAESQLLSRLKDPKALQMDCNSPFSGWVCAQPNVDIIMATADRFEKKLQEQFQYEPLESIASLYLVAAKRGNVDAKTKFHDLYSRGLAGIDKSWQSRTCFNGFLAIYEKKAKDSQDAELLAVMARELLKPENFVHYAGKAVQFYLEKAKLEGTSAKDLYSEIFGVLNSIQDSNARRNFNFDGFEGVCKKAGSEENPLPLQLLAEFYISGLPEGYPSVLSEEKWSQVNKTLGHADLSREDRLTLYKSAVQQGQRALIYEYVTHLLSGVVLDKKEAEAVRLCEVLTASGAVEDQYFEKASAHLGDHYAGTDPDRALGYYLKSRSSLEKLGSYVENPSELPFYEDVLRDWAVFGSALSKLRDLSSLYSDCPLHIEGSEYGQRVKTIGKTIQTLSSLTVDVRKGCPGFLMRTENKVIRPASLILESTIDGARYLTFGAENIARAKQVLSLFASTTVSDELQKCQSELQGVNDKIFKNARLVGSDSGDKFKKQNTLKAQLEKDVKHLQTYEVAVTSLKRTLSGSQLSAEEERH